MADLLRRRLSPVGEAAWAAIDEEATRTLKNHLSARSVVDVDGPHGWAYAALNTGRMSAPASEGGVQYCMRKVQPLVELRVPFQLSLWELDNLTRGAADPDLSPVVEAAKTVAAFEENALYKGLKAAGVEGLIEKSPHGALSAGAGVEEIPAVVGKAIEVLQLRGIGGPYALVLEPGRYHALMQCVRGGYPLYRVVNNLIGGATLWSTGVDVGAVVSTRGGDFQMVLGQDLSIGYLRHDHENVELFFTESFTARVLEPAASVPFKP